MDPTPRTPPATPLAPPTKPVPPTVPSTTVPDPRAAGERTCVVCAYSLQGLPPDGACPECGTPVAHSLRGNLLKYCSPDYLARLHRGVFLILTAIIIQFLLYFAAIGSTIFLGGKLTPPIEGLLALLGVAVGAASLYGYWLFSELDPGYAAHDTGATPRKTIRMAVLISGVVTVLSAVAFLLLPSGPAPRPSDPVFILYQAMNVIGFVAFVVQYFAAMNYIKWLAPRIPSEKIAKRAKLLTWLGPLLSTVGCLALGIGLLVAIVLYWNMFNWIREDLKRIRAAAEMSPRYPA